MRRYVFFDYIYMLAVHNFYGANSSNFILSSVMRSSWSMYGHYIHIYFALLVLMGSH